LAVIVVVAHLGFRVLLRSSASVFNGRATPCVRILEVIMLTAKVYRDKKQIGEIEIKCCGVVDKPKYKYQITVPNGCHNIIVHNSKRGWLALLYSAIGEILAVKGNT
jgi:hypothetical protein